jgi:hypothetical protein
MKITLTSEVVQPPPPRKLFYSLPDPVARKMPATRRGKQGLKARVSPKLEAYMRAMNRLLHPNMKDVDFEREWRQMYNGGRAFDNGKSYESGEWTLEDIFCAGATLEAVTGIQSNGRIEVYAIDPENPPPPPTSPDQIDMTRNFFPTTSQPFLQNGPFPQFDDPPYYGGGRFIHPFIGRDGKNWVDVYETDDGRGGLRGATKIEQPFIPARPDLTAGVIP